MMMLGECCLFLAYLEGWLCLWVMVWRMFGDGDGRIVVQSINQYIEQTKCSGDNSDIEENK